MKIEKPNFSSSLGPKAISVRSTFSGSKSPLAIISLQLTTRINSYCFAIQECLIYECFPRYWVYFSKELFSVISNIIRCSVTCFGVVSSHEAVPLFEVFPHPLSFYPTDKKQQPPRSKIEVPEVAGCIWNAKYFWRLLHLSKIGNLLKCGELTGVNGSYRFAHGVNGRLNQLQITDYKLRFSCEKERVSIA